MSVEDRLDEAREKLHEAREVARKRDAHEAEVLKAVRTMRETIAEKRAKRSELDAVEDADQRERIADKIEALEADLDQAVEKLDRIERRSKAANEELAKHKKRVERLREKRKEQQEAQDRPSPNFAWAEFNCNDGRPFPEASREAIKAWCRDIGEPVRARFGPVHINSAYRHAAYNASVGGATNSIHIYDLHPNAVAVDFTCASGSATDWFNFTAGKADGRGHYPGRFHHADNRNRIGWPDAAWSG